MRLAGWDLNHCPQCTPTLPPAPHPTHAPAPVQQLVYEEAEGDEVEDLYALLAFVKQRMPDVQVCGCGALLARSRLLCLLRRPAAGAQVPAGKQRRSWLACCTR